MKILLTGANGILGIELLKSLVKKTSKFWQLVEENLGIKI